MFAILRFAAAATQRGAIASAAARTALLSAALEDAVTRAEGAGARDRRARRRLRAPQRRNHHEPHRRTARRRPRRRRAHPQSGRPAPARRPRACAASHDDYRRFIGEPALSAVIDECLTAKTAVVRRTVHTPDGPAAPRRISASPCRRCSTRRRRLARRRLPLHRSHGRPAARGAAAAQGEPRDGRRADGRHRARVPQRPRDDSSATASCWIPQRCPTSYRPYVDGIRAETVSLGEIVTNFLNFARPAQLTLTRRRPPRDLRARRRGSAAEARSLGGDVTVRGSSASSRATRCCCARRSAICSATRSRRVSASVAPVVVVESDVDEGRVSTITVEDNGPGIEPGDRDRIFQPFFTSKRDGTGLGLALVQKIIVFHNGRVIAGTSRSAAPASRSRCRFREV